MDDERPEPNANVHLKDYLRLLSRHRWLITTIFVVTAVTGTVWTLLQTPTYRGSATVLIEPEAPKVLNIQEVTTIGAASTEYYRTQYALMTSRPVLATAVEALTRGNRTAALAALGAGTGVKPTGSLSIEPIRSTELVLVQFEHPNPVVAAEVATVVAHAYVKYNLDAKLKGTRDAVQWLNEQMSGLRSKVEESAVALQNYRIKAGILGIQEQRALTAQKAQEVNRAHLEAQAQRLSIGSQIHATRVAGSAKKARLQGSFFVRVSPQGRKDHGYVATDHFGRRVVGCGLRAHVSAFSSPPRLRDATRKGSASDRAYNP